MKIETDKEASWLIGFGFFLIFFGVCLFIAAYVEQIRQPQVIRLELGKPAQIVPSQGGAKKDWAGL